jgi:hypothetical protein
MFRRSTVVAALVAGCVAASSYSLRADVREDEKTHVELAGALGKVVNFFGGKAAREGVTSTVAVKGDRKIRFNDTTGQIIDLSEEKIYDLDMKKKTYKVTTFAELRRQMEEAQQRAQQQAKNAPAPGNQDKPAAAPPPDPNQKQLEFDVDVKNTGQTKTINGFETHETVLAITIREKGKTLEQSGGMVLTSDMWMTPRIAAMKEVTEFEMRYAQKMYGPMVTGISAEQMASAMAMYPMMKPALGRLSTEGAKLDGTSIMTIMTMDAVKSEEQMAQEAQQQPSQNNNSDSQPASQPNVGSLLGGFAKKMAAKKASKNDDQPKSRATFMTSTSEVLKVATEVSAAEVGIPAGFKEAK